MFENSIPEGDQPPLDLLLASIYYLMTRYAVHPMPHIAAAIVQHLNLLGTHSDCVSPVLKQVRQGILQHWQILAVATEPSWQGQEEVIEDQDVVLH